MFNRLIYDITYLFIIVFIAFIYFWTIFYSFRAILSLYHAQTIGQMLIIIQRHLIYCDDDFIQAEKSLYFINAVVRQNIILDPLAILHIAFIYTVIYETPIGIN